MAESNDSTGVSSTGSGGSDVDISEDTVFSILRNERRRTTLRFLRSESGWVPIDELARHVSAGERDTPVTRGSRAYKSVYVSLVQTHLPKMQSAGVIARDEKRNAVRLLPESAPLFEHLDTDSDDFEVPAVDMKETVDRLVVSIDLPGFGPEEVSLEVGANELEISADRSEDADDDTEFVMNERPNVVKRSVYFPVLIDLTQTQTTFEDGVLTVTLVKAQGSSEKKLIELE